MCFMCQPRLSAAHGLETCGSCDFMKHVLGRRGPSKGVHDADMGGQISLMASLDG